MESLYYRTFIGLPLRVKQPFLEARRELMTALGEERISWTRPEQYHVTLRFLGDTEIKAVDRIRQALSMEVALPKLAEVQFKELGSFGPRKRPRVLWVGFEDNSLFGHLKMEVDRALLRCGIPPDGQPFRAHLTLGRVRSLKDQEGYYGTVESMHRRFEGSVIADRMVFYRSILGPGGPEYLSLEELRFT